MADCHWKELYRYWLEKHVDGRPPSRRDIDPVIDIPRLVKNLILIDARNDFTYRVVGSEVVERHGLNMTGRRCGSSGNDPIVVDEWTAAVKYVAVKTKPRMLVSRMQDCDAEAENLMLLLPLVDCERRIEMIIVGSFYNEHFKPDTHVAGISLTEIAL